MSIVVMLRVLRGSLRLSPTEKLVLLSLGAYADDAGGNCWPSQVTLARETGLSERAIRNTLAALVRRGVIEIIEPSAARRSARYQIHLDDTIPMTDPAPRAGKDIDSRHAVPGSYRHDVPGDLPQTGTTFRPDRNVVPPRAERRAADPSIDPSLDPSDPERARALASSRNDVPPHRNIACRHNHDDELERRTCQELGRRLQPHVRSELVVRASKGTTMEEGERIVAHFIEAVLEAPYELTDAADPATWWRQWWKHWQQHRHRYAPATRWMDECEQLHAPICTSQLEHSNRVARERDVRQAGA